MARDAKLNIQGIARRCEGLVSCILPQPGNVFIGMDLSAGEPTATAHYSQDKMYRYATLDGIGKAPYFDNGILMIDDIYLMVMSQTPVGAPLIKEAWNKDWDGKTFVEQWLEKPKVIKSHYDDMRQVHKMWTLAWLYLMGAEKMQQQTADQFGINMSVKECKEAIQNFWSVFTGVKALVRKCSGKASEKGYIVNDFGYRITFNRNASRDESLPRDNCHKACNYLIQSTVSGIMHVYTKFLFEEAADDWLDIKYVTCIHDEVVVECPVEDVALFQAAQDRAVKRLNDFLNWSVPIRVGFTVGETFYDIK